MRSVTLVDSEVEFDVSELFFSTTDHKGTITDGNDIFVRVSEYAREELIGKPHNKIRHPDVPQAVFRLFWKSLKAGRPIVAYVKNRAKSGRYYWVIAYVQEIQNGYLSIRLKPTSALFSQVEPLYSKALAAERTGGMDAGERVLMEGLKSLGFDSYEDFMIRALGEELRSADTILGERTQGSSSNRALADAAILNQYIFSRSESFSRIGELVSERLSTVQNLKKDLKYIAVNTSIQSDKLGLQGASLTVVARLVQDIANSTSGQVETIQKLSESLVHSANEVSLNIGAAKIQIEMIARFFEDLVANGKSNSSSTHLVNALKQCIEAVETSMDGLSEGLSELRTLISELEKLVLTLEVARKTGLIESRRIGQEGAVFSSFLDSIDKIVQTERQKLAEFSSVLHAMSRQSADCRDMGKKIANCLGALSIA